jgi:hypothetical protein
MPTRKKVTPEERIRRHEVRISLQLGFFITVQKKVPQLDDLISNAPRHDQRTRERVEELEKCLQSVNECLQSAINRCRWWLSGDDGDQPRTDSVHCAAASNAARTKGNGATN